jgi:DNA polymerase-3 subunit delta
MALKSVRLEQLAPHLERDPPAPVYLLAGQEPLLLLEAADAVRAAARRHGHAERIVFEAGESGFDWDSLAGSACQGSLFGGDRRLLDLRLPGGKAGKDGSEALQAWATQAAGNPDTVLLVTCMQWGKEFEKPAWVSALAAVGWYVPVWPVRRHELPRWITARARSRGLALAPGAVALLAERTEGNLLACAQEIDKLVLLGESGTVAIERLDALLAEQSRLDVFALTDAVLLGDPQRALRIVRSLRAVGESPVPLLGWLGSQVELLARLAQADADGESLAGIFKAERVWDSRQDQLRSAVARVGARTARTALTRLARLDRLGKGQERGDVWVELERLVVDLARSRPTRRLAA